MGTRAADGEATTRATLIRMTTAQAIIRYLVAQHSERDGRRERLIAASCGIFGHGNVTGIGQALEQHTSTMPYHQARHEQSMVHMAIGFAKERRRRSTLLCTSSIGPGATNMVTGAATATINRLPVLLIPGDTYASRRQGTVLQQVEDPVSRDLSVTDTFRPVSRFFDRISRPEQILASLPEAMRVLTDPAGTGAVTIALPQDVGPEAGEFPLEFFRERTWPIPRVRPDRDAVTRALAVLAAASRPLIIAGGGVHYSEAWSELRALAERFGIPVAETFAGKGAVREPFDLLLGGIGVEGTRAANGVAARADVILCVGTRLADFVTASQSLFASPGVQLISINVAAHDAAKLGALALVGDARETLAELLAQGADAGMLPKADYRAEVLREKDDWAAVLAAEVFAGRPAETLSQGQLITVLNEHVRSGDVIVAAAGGPPGDLLKLWDATAGRECQIEFGNSCMGHEIPAALGVRLARPGGEVLAYVGDGTYLMSPSEIVTAVQDGLKVTIVIIENGGFQVIRRLQLAKVGSPFGNEFRARDTATERLDGPYLEIDLAASAESMGAKAWRVRTEDELRSALREARVHDGVAAIVVEVERHRFLPSSEAFWDVAPPAVSDDAQTAQLRADYESARRSQRSHG